MSLIAPTCVYVKIVDGYTLDCTVVQESDNKLYLQPLLGGKLIVIEWLGNGLWRKHDGRIINQVYYRHSDEFEFKVAGRISEVVYETYQRTTIRSNFVQNVSIRTSYVR